jgi:hypothetical protein
MATSKRPMPLLVRAKETTPPSTRTGGRIIDDLTALKAVTDDLLFLIHRPTDHMDYQATFALLKAAFSAKAYGMLQTVGGDVTSPEMTQAVDGTETLLETWTANGISSNTTPDYTTSKITVTEDGIYDVTVHICFSGQLSKTFDFELFKLDPTASPQASSLGYEIERKMGTGGDVGSSSCGGVVSLNAGESVMVYVYSGDGGNSVTIHHAQFKVVQV